jgi:hypothetical protein
VWDSESERRNNQGLGKMGRKCRIEQVKQESNGIIEQRNEQGRKTNEYPCNSSQAFESREWKRIEEQF